MYLNLNLFGHPVHQIYFLDFSDKKKTFGIVCIYDDFLRYNEKKVLLVQ